MNPPGPFTLQQLVTPPGAPITPLQLSVNPTASKSFNHVAGVVRVARASYADVNACTWYLRGGWETRNRRNMLSIRSLHGNEDSGWKDQK